MSEVKFESVEEFLARGGEIKEVPMGLSSRNKSGLTQYQQSISDRYRRQAVKNSRAGRGYKLVDGKRVYLPLEHKQN